MWRKCGISHSCYASIPCPVPGIWDGTKGWDTQRKWWLLPSSSSCRKINTTEFFFFLAVPHGIWNLSFPTRDWAHTHCNGRWTHNRQTTREVILLLNLRKSDYSLFSQSNLSKLNVMTLRSLNIHSSKNVSETFCAVDIQGIPNARFWFWGGQVCLWD